MDDYAIELDSVTKTFKFEKSSSLRNKLLNKFSKSQNSRLVALDNISLTVPKGEVLAIIGSNGSGKSTLLRTIAGIYQPDKGNVTVNGVLAPLLQIGTGFHKELNAKENIIMSGLLMGIEKPEIESKVNEIIRYAELEEFSAMRLKHYSTGMRARLAFSLSLIIDPDILLVDEILSVGDRNFRNKSYESFLSFKEKGKTILLVTHNLGKKLRIADRVALMEKGRISHIGKPDDVVKHYGGKIGDE